MLWLVVAAAAAAVGAVDVVEVFCSSNAFAAAFALLFIAAVESVDDVMRTLRRVLIFSSVAADATVTFVAGVDVDCRPSPSGVALVLLAEPLLPATVALLIVVEDATDAEELVDCSVDDDAAMEDDCLTPLLFG